MRAVFAALLWSSAALPATAQPTWPTKGWPVATPAAVGMNVSALDSIDADIRSGKFGFVDRFLVIRRGQLVYDRRYQQDYDRIYGDSARNARALRLHHPTGAFNYFNTWWHPYYRRGELHTLQSVTKTVVSMVIGVATTRGEFPSLDTRVLSFFDSSTVANVDDRKRRMTLRHLLTMTAGLEWNENLPYADTANTADKLEGGYDWVDFTIDRPMSEEPGTRFNYSSGATELLAHVFYRATGADIEEYAARHLFTPLGIRDWFWKRTPAGIIDTEGGLYLSATDLAKLWYLVLRSGQWEGHQVLSRDWLRASVAPAVAIGAARGAGYGLKWWIYPNPTDSTRMMWAGSGFGGQRPVIVPEDDLIVVMYQWNILPGQPSMPFMPTMRRVINAVTDRRR